MCWTVEEASEATASNVASQISSLRDDTGQKCVNEDEEANAEPMPLQKSKLTEQGRR